MPNQLPLVSVVIPSYNHAKYITDSIQSIIDQDYQNIELIIIDDGSTDSSVEAISEMLPICEKRFVRFEFRSRPNKGLCATLNEALNWCEGEYFAPLASDDIALPNKTSIQTDFLNTHPDVIIVFGGLKVIDNNNTIIDNIEGTNEDYNFRDVILQNANILAPTQMIRLSKIREVGGYDPEIEIEDWYMWLKLAQLGNLYSLDNYLTLYRYHDDNTSKKVDIMHKARLDVLSHFKDHNLYQKAINKVEWLNHYDLLVHIGDNKRYHFQKMMFLQPYLTTKLSFNKTIKIVKNKLDFVFNSL